MGCFSAEAPKPRNLAQETGDTLATQIALAPEQYAAESRYQPLYGALSSTTAANTLFGSKPSRFQVRVRSRDAQGNVIPGQYVYRTRTAPASPGLLNVMETAQPRIDAMSARSLAAQREGDIAAVEQLGGRATAALRAANPEQMALLDALNSEVASGGDSLGARLERQAMDELDLGAALDPSLAREVAQSVRAGQASRGMGFGRGDLAQEALFTGLQAEQLRRARQQFAMGVNQQRYGQRVGVAQLNHATATDPFQAILGRPAYSSAMGQSLMGMAGQMGQSSGVKFFDPFNAYASDLYNTNYNAKAAASIASANATSGLIGSGIGAVGSLGGSLGGAAILRG